MPSTHLSLHYHIVFSTKNRAPIIAEEWQSRLYAYLGGALRGEQGIAEKIGGVRDHVHLLVGLKATVCLAEVIRELKANSSKWVHQELGRNDFAWQEGYGAFTVSASQREQVRKYIEDQAVHHRHRSFQEEYLELLQRSGVEFDQRFLW